MSLLFAQIPSADQEKFIGGAQTTYYVRYNDGFLGGDGYFKNDNLSNSFEEAGKVVGTYDSQGGDTAYFESTGVSKTKDNGPTVIDEEYDGTGFTGTASRLGGESTVMQIVLIGNSGKYKLV